MTLIKELINIPERVQKGDFVLRLAEDIDRPEVVLDHYVVTPELATCFDSALSFIGNAVQNRSSKASYLHGSFGSGKSHFMAVLHLILQGNTAARSIPELAAVIQKHNAWLGGKKFLLVPYHMIGAHDMESGILGNYVDFMRRTHPEAPTPPVYLSASLIEQAQNERENYGDEPFFKRLNNDQSASNGGWGDLESVWTAETFEAAAAADPDSEPHLKLVSTLLKTVASSHAEVVSQRGGNFVRFDKGLSLMSQHAHSLGYDALILFLDELILWLATQSADLSFVRSEAAKLTNLVEAQSAERPIPLISFVARQRDLRELVGDHVPGAEKLSFSDSLDWQQGRFDTITLEDRNLPAIASKRVLKCKNDSARRELNAAFDKTARIKDNVMNILLTHEGNQEMFRQVYPFSPALVQTLIGVSSVLQRERTALKVMLQLLVDHRETLELGELIPVGDLFDVVAHGDEAFSPEMGIHFDNAKRLYHLKLLPLLEKEHNIHHADLESLPYNDPTRKAFRNDDRLIKTLLLSALVPNVESLRALNAEKLAALNHGTIKTPIPGKEAAEVLRRFKHWSGSVGEIRLGDESNPTITVQLSGVDTESIIEQVRREDNQGNRSRLIRQILFEQLGIQGEGQFEQFHEFTWRNTKRVCNVLFRNIRELPDSSLDNESADWKLVIDFPFDEPGHGPRDDLRTLQRFMQSHPEGSRTLCWVPSFFTADSQKDVGMLYLLDFLMTGERFSEYSSHLSPQDRQSAKTILESQRNQLRQRVKNNLDAAYGLDRHASDSIDSTHDLELNEHYASLKPGFTPQPPVAANLSGAMENLLSQALEHEFPAAPLFEGEIKKSTLNKVYELILPATQTTDGRLAIDKTLRPLLRQIAVPLQLGEMGIDATHFVLGHHWKSHFSKKSAETGSEQSVTQLRKWIDDPKPMGLPKEAQNLVILIYAAQTSWTPFLHGAPFEATIANLPDACELRPISLPTENEWQRAQALAASLFGYSGSSLLSAGNVNSLSEACQSKAVETRKACQSYCQNLKQHMTDLEITAESTDRMQTAVASQILIENLSTAKLDEIVSLLAEATIATSEAAMGECISKAARLEGQLNATNWESFELLQKLPPNFHSASKQILVDLKEAMMSDEHVLDLGPALNSAQARAMRLVSQAIETPPTPEGETTTAETPTDNDSPPPPTSGAAVQIIDQGTKQGLTLSAAEEILSELKARLKPAQQARVNVSWVIEEGGSQK